MEKKICNLCKKDLGECIYKPLGSRRNSSVYICTHCGLCQTIQDEDQAKGLRTLSSDAGWGNVRHAKGVRLEAQIQNIEDIISSLKPRSRILDVGSSRGQFLNWCSSKYPTHAYFGIESDNSLQPNIEHKNIKVEIGKLLELNLSTLGQFDFIFLNHSLEHFDDAKTSLEVIKTILSDEGILWIDVPNLLGINEPMIIEEFFIDKHMYHFEPTTLTSMLNASGFEIINDFSDNLNLVYAVRKSKSPRKIQDIAHITSATINKYFTSLEFNRSKLKLIALEIEENDNSAIYGSGRILDALIKYGGLTVERTVVADKFLWQHAGDLGINISNPAEIDWKSFNQVYVLARSSEQPIISWLKSQGAQKITTLQEIWNR